MCLYDFWPVNQNCYLAPSICHYCPLSLPIYSLYLFHLFFFALSLFSESTFHSFIHFSHDSLVSVEKDYMHIYMCVLVCTHVHWSAGRFSLMPVMACNFKHCHPAPHFKWDRRRHSHFLLRPACSHDNLLSRTGIHDTQTLTDFSHVSFISPVLKAVSIKIKGTNVFIEIIYISIKMNRLYIINNDIITTDALNNQLFFMLRFTNSTALYSLLQLFPKLASTKLCINNMPVT